MLSLWLPLSKTIESSSLRTIATSSSCVDGGETIVDGGDDSLSCCVQLLRFCVTTLRFGSSEAADALVSSQISIVVVLPEIKSVAGASKNEHRQ